MKRISRLRSRRLGSRRLGSRRRWLRYASVGLVLAALGAAFTGAYERAAGEDATGEPLFLYWASWPVGYEINERTGDDLPNIADGATPVQAIHRAFQRWREVAGANMEFEYLGTTPIERTAQDYRNVISFVDEQYAYNGRWAVANYWYYTSSGEFVECDIVYHPDEDFTTHGDLPEHFDIEMVTVHEIGHLIGLGHTGMMTVGMYPYGGPADQKSRWLWPDDAAGATDVRASGDWADTHGALAGTVRRGGGPAFGVHVVAINDRGEPVASRLTLKDGTYRIEALPPGDYEVVAEPLDRPVSQGNFTQGYWQSRPFDDDFPSLYLGGNESPDLVRIAPGQTTDAVDFDLSAQTVTLNARLIGRGERGSSGAGVMLGNDSAELLQGSTGEWDLFVAGEGMGEPATFEVEGPGIVRVTGFRYSELSDGTPVTIAGFDVDADASPGQRILRAESGGEISLMVGAVEIVPRPAQLMVVKDPLEPDAVYLTWYGGEPPYELVRDTKPDLSTGVPVYSEHDLDYSDPVLDDGQTYFYRIEP